MTASGRRVRVIHGPNLDLLGEREPDVYGTTTLAQLDAHLVEVGRAHGLQVECRQSNHEGAIIELLHEARTGHAAVVINPAGYGHTSVAIADALRAMPIPVIEVHLSNLYAREPMRHASVTAAACAGVVMGLGAGSYVAALVHLAAVLAPD